ncbi:MAG TPA: Flp pilus assembly protein CpaB [Oculatellaceae cyanobacterium]|jgi:pilus assembly protein CpaB
MPLRNLPIKTGHLFLGLAAIMFFITVAMFGGKKPEAAHKAMAEVPTIKVVVPVLPISEGKTLSYNDVTTVKWPREFLPKHSTFGDVSEVVGRVAKQDLFPGEPIFIEKLSGSDTNGGLPAVIPKGLRAVSVAVTEVKGVAGFVKPGDRVDVLSTFEVEQEGGNKVRTTRTVLQNVLVLASAQTMVNDNKYDMETPPGVTRGEATRAVEPTEKGRSKTKEKSDKEKEKEAKLREKERKDAEKAARLVSTVTLALTPIQSEALALAEETGEIRLALRPEADHSLSDVPGVSFDQLVGTMSGHFPPPPRIPESSVPAPPSTTFHSGGRQVEFIQGTDKTMLSL